jgi:hypothetical protein
VSLQDLAPLAEPNLARVTFAGSTPEQRMLTGFVYAKQAMQQLLPQGHVVDMGAAIVTQETYEAQIEERRAIVASSFQQGTDLPEEAAISDKASRSREYWISTYALAAEGIGAYASGYAKQQVSYGLLSEKDYYDGIELRTKSFANIVQASQRGQLAALMLPDAYYQSAMQASSAATTLRLGGQVVPEKGAIVLNSDSTKLMALTPSKSLVPVQLGDFGISVTTMAVIGIVVAITAVGITAFVVRGSVEKERIRQSAEFMGRMCEQATKENNPAALAACREYADKITTPTPQPFGLDQLSKYLVWGAVGLAALWMLPSLIERSEEASFRRSVRSAARGG